MATDIQNNTSNPIVKLMFKVNEAILTPPKKTIIKNEPEKPIKPILRDKPELSLEAKVGKREVVDIINRLLLQA